MAISTNPSTNPVRADASLDRRGWTPSGGGAKATPISVPPRAKTVDLRWLWLLIGFALLPFTAYRVVFPLAAWIAPVFLLRFERVSRRGGPALWLIFAAYMLAGVIDLIGTPGRGLDLLLGLTLLPLVRAVRFTLPYVTDRLLGARLGTWPRMLLFPASFVASDWLMGLLHITGTVGSPAYSQYGVLPLMQLVSVTGMYGLTFLVMWFASAVNAVWDHGSGGGPRGCRWPSSARCWPRSSRSASPASAWPRRRRRRSRRPRSPSAQRFSIRQTTAWTGQRSTGPPAPSGQRGAQVRRHRRPDAGPHPDRTEPGRQTRGLAGAVGAGAARGPAERHQPGRSAGPQPRRLPGNLARRPRPNAVPALFANQAILISPAGSVVWTYNKTYPVVVNGESAIDVRGSGVLPVADTPYGRLSTAICNDVGYPGLLRQAGQKGADILLVPTDEPSSVWASADAAQATYRAIENGTSLIRRPATASR